MVLRIADTSVLRGVPISVVCMPLRGAEPPPYAADALRCAVSRRAPIDVGGSFLPADWRCMVGTHTLLAFGLHWLLRWSSAFRPIRSFTFRHSALLFLFCFGFRKASFHVAVGFR